MLKNKGFHVFIAILVTIIIFFLLFSEIDFISVVGVISQSNFYYLLLAFFVLIVIPLIKAGRWRFILKTLDHKTSFKESLFVTIAAFSFVTITQLGDLSKTYFMRKKMPMSLSAGAVLTEKIFDILALLIFALVGIFLYPKADIIIAFLIVLGGIFALFFISFFNFNILPLKWKNLLKNVLSSLNVMAKKPRYLIYALFYSLFFWSINILQIALIFYALRIEVPFFFMLANIPFAIFIGLLPITIGGMGTRDSAILYLFRNFATSPELLGAGILYSFLRFWLVGLSGIPFLAYMNKKSADLKE